MSKILHITHPQINYNKVNKNSILLLDKNTKLIADEYHTSLGDLTAEDIISIISKFDSINYYNNGFTDDEISINTKILLNFIKNFKPISNFSAENIKDFTSNREIYIRPEESVLWVFGCSHSHGTGLKDFELSFGKILAQNLSLPPKIISQPGSSLGWSLRHLINADIRSSDIVVWQITTPPRISIYDGNKVKEIMLANNKNQHLLEIFNNEQIYFTQLSLLQYGVKYLREKNVKFVLTSIETKFDTMLKYEYSKYPEYCYSPDFYIDLGSDGIHAGPLSHKKLALSIENCLQYRNA
jgi:uncharacterized protein (DUF2164 family)